MLDFGENLIQVLQERVVLDQTFRVVLANEILSRAGSFSNRREKSFLLGVGRRDRLRGVVPAVYFRGRLAWTHVRALLRCGLRCGLHWGLTVVQVASWRCRLTPDRGPAAGGSGPKCWNFFFFFSFFLTFFQLDFFLFKNLLILVPP